MIQQVRLMSCGYNFVSFRFKLNIRGMAHTLANVFRRTLLSQIYGWSIIGLYIDNINHELDRLEGVKEDITTIIANLKKICFVSLNKCNVFKVILKSFKSGPILASHLYVPKDVLIVNYNQYICLVGSDVNIRMEFVIAKDIGYMSALEVQNKYSLYLEGHMILDANYNPIKRVSFNINDSEFDIYMQDSVELIIETNGTVNISNAIKYCCTSFVKCFSEINNFLINIV